MGRPGHPPSFPSSWAKTLGPCLSPRRFGTRACSPLRCGTPPCRKEKPGCVFLLQRLITFPISTKCFRWWPAGVKNRRQRRDPILVSNRNRHRCGKNVYGLSPRRIGSGRWKKRGGVKAFFRWRSERCGAASSGGGRERGPPGRHTFILPSSLNSRRSNWVGTVGKKNR